MFFAAGEPGRPSVLQEQPEPVLLELCLLPDGDNVHGGLRRHRLCDGAGPGLPGPLPPRRTGEYGLLALSSTFL